MKIKRLEISGVGGIRALTIVPHDKMNIICGPNGIGKTTLLESVGHLFSAGGTNILKRHVSSERGLVKASLFQAPFGIDNAEYSLNTFEPDKEDHIGGQHRLSDHVISLKTTRTFGYQPLQSVSRDTQKPENVLFTEARNGISLKDVKNWFVNRYLYSAHKDALRAAQIKNFELAKSCFSKLNTDFKFLRVDAGTNEIMVSTPSGNLYYEYLSSGFKSCLSILFGVIKEIEYRFADTIASDFKGLVLIDELELHLHPDWQSKIVGVLTDTFPEVQFFVTTHSPHIIQSAAPETIIALEQSGDGVQQRTLPISNYGFNGWTIEEVLADVMGMKDTRTSIFVDTVREFNKALNEENIQKAKELHRKLDCMLHPNSVSKKIFALQLSAIVGE